jgi:hypothetical protein
MFLSPESSLSSENNIRVVRLEGLVVEDNTAFEDTCGSELVNFGLGGDNNDLGLEPVNGVGSRGAEAESENMQLDGSAGGGEEVERLLVTVPNVHNNFLRRH